MINNIENIVEFVNDGVPYGVYSVVFNGDQKVFIRNNNSVGAVVFYLGKFAEQCVSEIREDVKQEFFEKIGGSAYGKCL